MPTESEIRSRRDSWPPTQLRLQRPTKSGEPRPLLEDIDDDPLTYFLTPAPTFEDSEDEDLGMDFDAGIEITGRPREIVRSVSPSNLDGLRKPNTVRPGSPDSDITNPYEDDDDNEDYIRFTPYNPRITSLRDLQMAGLSSIPRSANHNNSSVPALLSPASFPGPQARGRTYTRGRMGQTRSLSAARSRPTHLWREPSPDVWSIEEETEEELMSDAGSSVAANSDIGQVERRGLEMKAAKPKKKVRFVLPVKE